MAVRTPQTENYRFLASRHAKAATDTAADTSCSDTDHTKLDSCRSSPARSPRPRTLPVGRVADTAASLPAKRQPPRGSDIPGMPDSARLPSPPGPRHVRSYASNIVEGLLR